MSRYLSYKDEMKRLEKLLAEVSTDEESINEEDEEIFDEEGFSDHNSNSEEDFDSSNESDISESVDYYVGKDKITKWSKIEPRLNVRTLAHNIVTKLPGNVGNAKELSSPLDSWLLLIDKNIISAIVDCTNIYI